MAHFPAEREIVRMQIANRLGSLAARFYRLSKPIDGWQTVFTGISQDVTAPPASGWQPFEPPAQWGGPEHTNWFRTDVTVPAEFDGLPVYAILPVGGEALCFVDGVPHQGLDENRWPVQLAEHGKPGQSFDILIEAWSKHSTQQFRTPTLCVRDSLAWDLYWDLRVAFETALENPAESAPRVQLLDLVDSISRKVDVARESSHADWHDRLTQLRSEFAEKLAPFKTSAGMGSLTLTSHSHIDVAWIWPLRETRRKVGRTWSTVLHYMDQYPEVTFLQSQPQLYEYVRDHFPDLWERVKQRVKEGRWEVNGAAWVEQDTNLPCGESHVRQYLFGNRFYRQEFGVHARMVWLPDCFGFTFSLPQIMKKAQVDTFGTWKLIFNEYQHHPYCFFRWRGIDGTEVPAVSLPTLCGGDPNPHELKRHWDAFRQKDLTSDFLYVFGHGDGGGGPTPEMFEYVRREDKIAGVPKSRFGNFQDAFDQLSENVDWERVPVFHDEMYFELHRGCQTTQARTKRNNRLAELAARDTEYLASRAWLDGADYPTELIHSAWKLILLNQFHDILPGSSIAEVYDDAERDYAAAFDLLRQARTSVSKSGANESSVVVHNTLGWNRTDVVEIEGAFGTAQIGDGASLICQQVTGANGTPSTLVEMCELEPFSAVQLQLGEDNDHHIENDALHATTEVLENEWFRVEFASDGTFGRILDKRHKRELLAAGARGNVLMLYYDRPAQHDAWDIDFNFREDATEVSDLQSIDVIESGPVRATVRVVRSTGKSVFTQYISLWRSIPRIDIRTVADWNEKNRLLKAVFPVNVLSRTATYEIQYGAIERPTHYSTSHDRARFEVPGHRWIDLSETGYGVSLLNDCKYGFSVHDNEMAISLLRSSTNPDPHADEGRQEFTYSLYPHSGSWQDAHTVRKAYELNVPLRIAAASSPEESLVKVDAPNVVVDWIKKAEDSDELIVRLYESHGARGTATLSFSRVPANIVECDLMEENDEGVECEGSNVVLSMRPWDIRTLKVRF